MKIVNIFGTRPQYIKVAAVMTAVRDEDIVNIDTGQHYDYSMSKVFIDGLDIKINHKEKSIMKLKKLVENENPDFVLIYGDTYSSILGLVSSKGGPWTTCHVESGVRCGDYSHVEEINRITIDHMCDVRFCPTTSAVNNLFEEGINGIFTGDVMYDILRNSKATLNVGPEDFIYVTLHRPVNVDSELNLKRILNAFESSGKTIIFPAHPRTKKSIERFQITVPPNVWIIDPVPYGTNLDYIRNASGIITDSGGVQKEAHILRTPCLTILETTPWPESAEDGWNRLVNPETLYDEIDDFPKGSEKNTRHYGDGKAAEYIMKTLRELYEKRGNS
jgi:UDP-N-acetylglucosamine 2-epimerase (non-hydrolysing)